VLVGCAAISIFPHKNKGVNFFFFVGKVFALVNAFRDKFLSVVPSAARVTETERNLDTRNDDSGQ
jgi:hypothetical protein